MILELLFEGCINLFAWILGMFNVEYPDVFNAAIVTVTNYVTMGVEIINFYYPSGYLSTLCSFLMDFFIAYFLICLVKKIIALIPVIDANLDK